MLSKILIAIPGGNPVKSNAGSIGYGEPFVFNGNTYFYNRIGKFAPKDKPFLVSREYMFCGRQNGIKEWYLLCFNNDKFYVLSYLTYEPKKSLSAASKFTNEKLIDMLYANIKKYEEINKNFDINECEF